jgi:hypothetical protein
MKLRRSVQLVEGKIFVSVPLRGIGYETLAIFKPYPAILSKGSIDAPHFSLNKQALLTGFQENGHLGTLARYAIDTPQRNYAVFKVREGCVELTIQIRLMAKNKKVNLNNTNKILHQATIPK